MLYVFYGDDRQRVRAAADLLIDSLREREGDLTVERIEGEGYESGRLANLAAAASLFGGKKLYLIDVPTEALELWGEVLREAGVLQESEHHFIILERPLVVADKKQLQKAAITIEEYKAEKVDRFNTFSLADALARKDKKNLWILLQDATKAGIKTEEAIGILWWQLKTMRLAAKTKSATEAGVKEFSYTKAKRALAVFAPGEIEVLSRKLLQLYHDGHMGKCDIDLALEEWVLRM
jgi:DNA polymerase III delta subunit